MNSDTISHIVKGLKNKYKECDPFELCKSLNIIIGMVPMGTHDGSCKGFFISRGRKKMITINSELQPALQRIIAAHELGHAALHGDTFGMQYAAYSARHRKRNTTTVGTAISEKNTGNKKFPRRRHTTWRSRNNRHRIGINRQKQKIRRCAN